MIRGAAPRPARKTPGVQPPFPPTSSPPAEGSTVGCELHGLSAYLPQEERKRPANPTRPDRYVHALGKRKYPVVMESQARDRMAHGLIRRPAGRPRDRNSQGELSAAVLGRSSELSSSEVAPPFEVGDEGGLRGTPTETFPSQLA